MNRPTVQSSILILDGRCAAFTGHPIGLAEFHLIIVRQIEWQAHAMSLCQASIASGNESSGGGRNESTQEETTSA